MPEIDDAELEAELDALGDELAFDEDTTYLDEASSAPNAPTAVPGSESATNKVSETLYNKLLFGVYVVGVTCVYHLFITCVCH